MTGWQKFRNRFLRIRKQPVVLSSLPAVPIVPDWTALDRDRWKAVLNSETGRKFVSRARAVHFKMLNDSGEDHFHAAQSVHAARGFGEAIVWLQSLSASCSAQQEKQTDSGGLGEVQPVERDDHLVRMSPH